MINKHCSWCDNSFQTAVSYQIYCSAPCREDATKEKIFARYEILRRKRRSGKVRPCASCGQNLSAYNDEPICQACLVNPKDISERLKEIKGLMNGKPWKD